MTKAKNNRQDGSPTVTQTMQQDIERYAKLVDACRAHERRALTTLLYMSIPCLEGNENSLFEGEKMKRMGIEVALSQEEISAIGLEATLYGEMAAKYEAKQGKDDDLSEVTYQRYLAMREALNRIYYVYMNQHELESKTKKELRRVGTKGKDVKSTGDIGWHCCEILKNVFFALLRQAETDSDDSYEKMISWIWHIPENAPFGFNRDEMGCFNFAVMQSVPVEDEDALE